MNEGTAKEERGEEQEALRLRVSELERSEDELQRMKKALETGMSALDVVLENSRDILTILSQDGVVLYVSPSVERIAGYRREELTGANAFEYIHPDDFDQFLISFTVGMVTPGHAIQMEFRYRHADGSWRNMEAQGINLADNPAVPGMVLTARDISDRKAIEKKLQRSQSYYRSLIRNAADMISVLDRDLCFKWGSPSAARITGYAPEDVYGKPLISFIHPDDVESAQTDHDFVLGNPGISLAAERRFRHKDGTYHWHEAILTNLLDDPSVEGLIINSRDISERKLMEDELLASNRELDSFASTVSHDLRTPLALIEGYAQLMRAEGNSEEEREAYLKSIISAARRMNELTESLLEYAQAGQTAGTVALVEPLDILSDVLFEHANEIEGAGIEIVLGEEFPPIRVDHFRLRQVFSNLVNNAAKYLAGTQYPRMEVGTWTGPGEVTFYVRDNGPGLDPETAGEIFQPFKRFGKAGTPGLGIGLSTVKKAVEGWGGRLWVESEPGKGATFFFSAPMGADQR